MANCICRLGIVVRTRAPAVPAEGASDVPFGAKISVLPSPGPGGAKLGWFMILNISKRNWMLKSSEILVMRLFLNTEKSRLVTPGPIRTLRPELPRRLKQRRSPGPRGAPSVGGAGSQFASKKA